MKNLKKVLALVMAFAMVFTMMATAGAAYTDQADIEATEAVEMLNAIGVMTGDPDGSFRPNDTITRAEACRMIYTIRTNSDDASAYADMQTTFKDVPADAWYAGYVKHCQAAGIVSGTKADGSAFEPSREVTGVELALMCLRVMGYDPAKADIGGSTWSTKTISIATEAGILKDVNTTITADCPRQWAAQIMYNTIQAPTVEWSTDSNSYSKYFEDGNERDSVGREYLDLYTNIGTLVTIERDTLTITMNDDDQKDSDTTATYFTKLAKDYTDLLGQRVKVLFTDGKTNQVVGVYAVEDNTVVTANQNAIEIDTGKLKIDGVKYTLEDNGVATYIDGDQTDKDYKAGDFKADQSANVITFIDSDENGKIDKAYIKTYEVKKVTYVSSSQIIAGGKSYQADEENIDENLVKDDWAIITHNLYGDNLDIVKADVATGKVNATKDKSGWKQFQIDETWYNETNSADGDVQSNVKAGVDAEYVAVNGILFYAKKTSGVTDHLTDVLFVAYHGTDGLANNQARVMFPNGTEETIDLKNNYVEDQNGAKSTVNGGTIQNGAVYEYYKSGSKYQLVDLNSAEEAYGDYTTIKDSASDGVKLNTSGKIASVEGYAIDDGADVIVFTANSGDATKYSVKHITGKQLKTFTATAGPNDTNINDTVIAAFESDVNGLTRATALFVKYNSTTGVFGSNMDSISAYANYGFITKDAVRVGNDQIKFNVWTGSEDVEVYADQTNETKFAKGTIIGYDSITAEDDKNIIDDIFAIPLKSGMASGVVAGSITSARNDGEKFVVNSTEYDVDDDFSTVLYVSTSDKDETIGIVDGKATAAHDPLKNDAKRATNILYYGKEVAVIDVNEIAGETYANHVLFDDTADSTYYVNEISDFSSVQWLNNRTGDTDNTKAYDNAQMTLSFYSKAAGTLKLSGVDGAPKTLNVVAGTNKFEDIYVTGNVTATWTPDNAPSNSDVVLEKAGYVDAGLKYGSNSEVSKLTFTVENGAAQIPTISFGTAGADNSKFSATLKDGSGNAATLVPSDARTAFYYEIKCASTSIDEGTYVATIDVDGKTITENIVVAKAKIAAAPTISSLGLSQSFAEGQTVTSATGTTTLTTSETGLNTTADFAITQITGNDDTTLNDAETWKLVVTLKPQTHYEFAASTTAGSITHNLTLGSSTVGGSDPVVGTDSNGNVTLTYTITIAS